MASTDALNLPIKATAIRIPIGPFFDDTGLVITGWTGADSEISKDGGSFTDCTNEATEIGTSGAGYLDLTSTETNTDGIWIKTTITNTDARPFFWYSATQRAGAYIRGDTRELSGTAQTARDIGASVLLSPGTGTGQISLSSGAVTAGTVSDKTGYSLTQTFPANFSALAITAGGAVTAGTVSDKTGYSLASGGLASITTWTVAITGNITGNLSGSVGSVTGLTASNLDATISSRLPTSSYSAPPSAATIATQVDTTLTASHGSGSWSSGGSGSGAYTITVTVTDGTDPLQNAIVRVTEGINSYTVSTNASGQGAFALDAATYDVAVTKDGYQFTPTTRTVTGNEAGTLTNDLELTETVIPAPASPDLCTVSMYCVDAAGAAVSGLVVTFTLYPENASRNDDNVITTRTKTATSNGSGLIQVALIRTDYITQAGAYYKCTATGASVVPSQPIYLTAATYDLSGIIV